jgi:hypothetical protein
MPLIEDDEHAAFEELDGDHCDTASGLAARG